VVWELASGGARALLVSLFNMEWRCYDGVGILPLLGGFSFKVFSSVSPRFYFRKQAFCFLPLVTILESPHIFNTLSMGHL
jgi:hypothetical protein